MVTLCRVMGFPSRLVTGFIVRQGADIQPHVWVEVFQNQEWVPFDPANGYSVNLPMNYVPVRRDADVVQSSPKRIGLDDSLFHQAFAARSAIDAGRAAAPAPDSRICAGCRSRCTR